MSKKIVKNTPVNNLEKVVSLFNFRIWLKGHWKVLLVLFLLVNVAYFNSLKADFVSDDVRSVLRNGALDKISYAMSQGKIVLQSLIHFFINKIFGHVPIYYRLVNIFFHIATVFAVYLLFCILNEPKIAFFTAALLAVHPIETESVTWISGGPYVQYAFFAVFSFLFLVLSYKNRKLFKFSVIAFIISLSAHDMAVVFPLMVFSFILSFGNLRRDWRKLIPFFAIVFIFVLAYLWRISYRINSFQTNYYQESAWTNPFLKIPVAITTYLELIFWPKELTLYHSEMVFGLVEFVIRAVLCVIFFGIILYSLRKNRKVFFGLSLFIISLLPTLTPFNITWVVAERYVYLGSIGIFMVVSLLFKKLSENSRLKIFINIFFFLIIMALLTRTIIRNIDWKNEDNLYIATGKTSPSSPNTHNNLGDVYGRQGNTKKAIEEFKKAIEIKPDYADAYHNLGNVYQSMGRYDEAMEYYQKAIHFNPRLWQSYNNLGSLLFSRGDVKLAGEYFVKAIEADPFNPEPQKNLGVLYFVLGMKEPAKEQFLRVLQLDPSNPIAKKYLQSLN